MKKGTAKDTIAAISTPLGHGGIGIIRISGGESLRIADIIFKPAGKGLKPSDCATHTVHYGHIHDRRGGVVDEVMLTVLKAPRTYTAEDVVEIGCHGGIVPLRKVLELCLDSGARMAEPGEFTKRAFLNGRMDLSQAEAVIDIINSESDAFCRAAVEQLGGSFSKEIKKIRGAVIDILAQIELAVDFTEEDVDFASGAKISAAIKEILERVRSVLATADRGMAMRKGVKVVICGKPNAGKSSLMNALLKHDRVIVAPHAGTTRDVVEEYLNVQGSTVRISDTAGIGKTSSELDLEGMKRSRKKIGEADIAVLVLDAASGVTDEDNDIYEMIKDKKSVIVINKTDRGALITREQAEKIYGAAHFVETSVVTGRGLEELEKRIGAILQEKEVIVPEGPIVTNIRYKEALELALAGIERAMKVTGEGFNPELLASDLSETIYSLGYITGETIKDDILERIFSRFCIGK